MFNLMESIGILGSIFFGALLAVGVAYAPVDPGMIQLLPEWIGGNLLTVRMIVVGVVAFVVLTYPVAISFSGNTQKLEEIGLIVTWVWAGAGILGIGVVLYFALVEGKYLLI